MSDTVSSAQSAAKSWANGNGRSASVGTNPYAPTGAPNEFSAGSNRAGSYAGRPVGDYDTGGGLRQSATDAFESVSRATSSAFDSGMEAARSARESAYYAARRANRTIGDTVQSNPLVFAGLGLVVGALLASSLPRTEIEDKFVGPSRDALKQRAKDAAADQYETVKSTASEIMENVVESAKHEGLSPEGADASAQDIAQKIRRVADAGISTAMKAGGENTESGGRNHG